MLAHYISLRYVKLYVCTFFSMIARGIGQLARFVLLVHCVAWCVLCVVCVCCVLCSGLNHLPAVQCLHSHKVRAYTHSEKQATNWILCIPWMESGSDMT